MIRIRLSCARPRPSAQTQAATGTDHDPIRLAPGAGGANRSNNGADPPPTCRESTEARPPATVGPGD